MTDLLLHGKAVGTVFDLLGDKEDDVTYSLGWALANSDDLVRQLLVTAYGGDIDHGQLVGLRLQQSVVGAGRTDVEVETDRLHLILEAKRGWWLPETAQLATYTSRFERSCRPLLLVVAECTPEYASQHLPAELDGIPVGYMSWAQVAELAASVAAAGGSWSVRQLIREFVRYLRGLMTMQDVNSNLAYVLSLGQYELGDSGLSFKDIVVEHRRYFHPVGGGPGGWPKVPPNYLAFRYSGHLRHIHHVEGYEVFDPPDCPGFPQLADNIDWAPGLHYLYHLGPPILPQHPTHAGPSIHRSMRVWAALDLLLTCETITEARNKTKMRLEAAGED